MAGSEVGLPRSQLDHLNDTVCGNNTGNSDPPPLSPQSAKTSDGSLSPWDKEKQYDIDDEGDEAWPIQYRYLTFATDLPQPTSITPRDADAPLPPAPPDLKQFESPFQWADSRKRLIIWISVVATTCTAFTAGACKYTFNQR
jgi:hypothetical protein